jgi:hypothetical protein
MLSEVYFHVICGGTRGEVLTFRPLDPAKAVCDGLRDTPTAGGGSEGGASVDSAPSWGL